jgi:hypothetical protein
MRLYTKIILAFSFVVLLASCSPNIARHDDAIRLKPEYYKEYSTVALANGKQKPRNATALRGTVRAVQYQVYLCPEDSVRYPKSKGFSGTPEIDSLTNDTLYRYVRTVALFLDNTPNALLESIPIDKIDFVSNINAAQLDTNYYWFEAFNQTLNSRTVREVKLDTLEIPCVVCDCENIVLQCPCKDGRENHLNKWFSEYKLGVASYNDLLGVNSYQAIFNKPAPAGEIIHDKARGDIIQIGRNEYFAEVSVGRRIGKELDYVLGLSFMTGVPTYLYSYNDDITGKTIAAKSSSFNPAVMLYVRHTLTDIYCMRPFVYGQFGIPIGTASLELLQQEWGKETSQEEATWQQEQCGLDIDFGLPFIFGGGIGVDIPVTCNWDISVDLSYKNIAVGEFIPTLTSDEFDLKYTRRNLNVWCLRFGLVW